LHLCFLTLYSLSSFVITLETIILPYVITSVSPIRSRSYVSYLVILMITTNISCINVSYLLIFVHHLSSFKYNYHTFHTFVSLHHWIACILCRHSRYLCSLTLSCSFVDTWVQSQKRIIHISTYQIHLDAIPRIDL
jgi:hypothetical protein